MAQPLILVVNGPNLNLLGFREPSLYGTATLAQAEQLVRREAQARGFEVDFFQSNAESALLDKLQSAFGRASGVIVNPGGFTSTSIALLDTLLALDLPTVEVHVTNIFRREGFRHHSYVSLAAHAVIAGAGIAGYGLAVAIIADAVGHL